MSDFYVTKLTNLLMRRFQSTFRKDYKGKDRLAISKKIIKDDGGVVQKMGWATIAKEEILAGEFVCAYGGENLPKPPPGNKRSDYNIAIAGGIIDADGPMKVRSYGALSLDSFPNCILVSLPNTAGTERAILVAIAPIKPRELITWNYGNKHSVKSSDHIELRPKALNSFIKNANGTEKSMVLVQMKANEILSSGLKQKEYGEIIGLLKTVDQVVYVKSTPSVYTRYCLELMIQRKETASQLDVAPEMREKVKRIEEKIKQLPHPEQIMKAISDFILQVPAREFLAVELSFDIFMMKVEDSLKKRSSPPTGSEMYTEVALACQQTAKETVPMLDQFKKMGPSAVAMMEQMAEQFRRMDPSLREQTRSQAYKMLQSSTQES